MLERKKISRILVILFLALFALVFFIHKHYVVPILMYHSVNPQAKPQKRMEISPETFQRQMGFLKRHHYNVVTLKTIADLIRDRKKIPPKTLAITFDDGYKDNYTYAFPILKKYNFPATIFIIINEVGRPEDDRLSWDEIKVMQGSGIITFGSHTLSHAYLPEISSDQELKFEIFDSKRMLEEQLGREVSIFSYPGGRFNTKIKQFVRDAGYKVAVATNPGKRFPNNDIFVLKRLRISSTSNNLFVFWIETSGYYTFIKEHRDDD